MIKWPAENMLLVTLPHDPTTCFVANVQTGAWAKYIGWDVQCVALFNKKLYFSTPEQGRKMFFAKLFMTHPPIEERVAILRGMNTPS
jgi:hypothetical protein